MRAKTKKGRGLRVTLKWTWLAIILLGAPGLLYADWSITQTTELKVGWNAVFLEVEPDDPQPKAVFNEKPIDQVLTYYPIHSPVEFIEDPDQVGWKKPGWHRWVPPEAEEAFLNNLYALQANQAYLIHCKEEYTWEVTGTPKFQRRTWQPDSFNFVGFHVDPDTTPTFEQYFDGSKAHADAHIYYLENNLWKRLGETTTTINAGEAFWVYCQGGSDYMGPLDIKLPHSSNALRFLVTNPVLEIAIANPSPHTRTVTLAPVGEGPFVPLSREIESLKSGETSYEPLGPAGWNFSLKSGSQQKIRLAVRREEITANEVKSLLKITDNLGNRFYIPVWAERLKIE